MKKRTLVVASLGAIFMLASCENSTSSSSSIESSESIASSSTSVATSTSTSTSTTSTSISSSSIVSVALGAPVLTLNEGKTGLIWADVANAVKYQIKVNDDAFADGTSYAFASDVAVYTVKVKAIGDGVYYTDSQEATWTYETKAISLSDLAITGLSVSWTAVACKVGVGYAADGNITTSSWAETTSSSYVAAASGKVGVVVSGGYDEAGNINYVGEVISKYGWAVNVATENKTLLDKATDVADDLTAKTYITSGWEDAGAHAAVSIAKSDIEETEESVDFKIQQLSNAYDFGLTLSSGLDAYKGVSLTLKGDGKTSAFVQLKCSSGYASYSIGVLNDNWHSVVIPFDDAGWKVNGTAVTLSEFALSQGFPNAGAALYGFTSIDLIFKTVSDAGYAYTHMYVKNLILVATDEGSIQADVQTYIIAGSYTGTVSEGPVFKLSQANDGSFTFATLDLSSNISTPVDVTKGSSEVTIKSQGDDGAALTYVGTVGDKGRSIVFKSASGTYASSVQGLSLNYVFNLDTFETYTETGVGYDQSNSDVTARTGLRGQYFSDFYAGSSSTIVSGSGWSLMGSADYLNLDTTEANAHSGVNSATVKVGNAMRHTTYGLSDGTALAWPKADTFSFWMKSPAAVDLSMSVRLYTTNLVNSSNYAITAATLTLPASSGWTQYTVALDATKTYYGFSMTFEHPSNWITVYPSIDDIQLYTGGNPWATYVDTSVVPNGTVMTGKTAYLPSVTATFAADSKVAVVAVDAASASHNLAGTYVVDSLNNITIDCGADLVYVGLISSDHLAISYASATGTLSTYVANLFLEGVVTGKTRIEGFENTTSTAIATKYTIDRDISNSGTWTNPADNLPFVVRNDASPKVGFAACSFAMDTTASGVGKYRYRFAQTAAFGSFTNFSMNVRNDSSLAIVGYLYICTASGTSASGRVATSIYVSLPANTGWTSYAGTVASSTTIYGYSFFFTATAPSTDVVTGFIGIDEVLAW